MDWQEQYKHPNWQKKRLEKLNESGWVCESCNSHDDQLHVHHNHYIKGRKVWEYSNDELRVLCDECHKEIHKIKDTLNLLLAKASDWMLLQVIGYMKVMVREEGEFIDYSEPFEQFGIADALGICVQEVVEMSTSEGFPIAKFNIERIKRAKG